MHTDYIILVIEDERPLLDAIRIKLENSGISVVTARTAQQGLRYLEEVDKIDGIWLDHYLLGKESGLDLVAKLKAENSPWQQMPIFVVSNTAGADKVQAYIRFGVTKYFTKSDFRLDQIVNDIMQYFSTHSKN